jgi:hypothetical protein
VAAIEPTPGADPPRHRQIENSSESRPKRRRPESNRCRRLCSASESGAFRISKRLSATSDALSCPQKTLGWGEFGESSRLGPVGLGSKPVSRSDDCPRKWANTCEDARKPWNSRLVFGGVWWFVRPLKGREAQTVSSGWSRRSVVGAHMVARKVLLVIPLLKDVEEDTNIVKSGEGNVVA